MNPFQSLRNYEEFINTLKQRYPLIERITLFVVPRGRRIAVPHREMTFAEGYRLSVQERLSFDIGNVVIEFYGYELWKNNEKIAWYDAQPHPNEPSLASTHPHHKHIPPDIKHHRIPAPGLSFTRPNLPFLIQEIEGMIAHEK